MINAESENCQHMTRYGMACHGELSRANRCKIHLEDLSQGTLYVVVNGRMVKESEASLGEAMDIEQHDHKHGNRSATRYTRAALTRAEYLGTLPKRHAQQVSRRLPAA